VDAPTGDLDLARARARWARRYRELLVAEVAGGRLGAAEVLSHDRVEPLAGTIKAVVLLEALPGIGKVRARRALERVGAGASVRLAALGADQRRRLLTILPAPDGAGLAT
jgi:hypothetical protein